jgi:hypothetical protein
VPEEPVAESPAVAGALDQPRDVGDHEVRGVVDAHHAEVRLEGGERVVGDLRPGGRDDADQRALADVGEPDEGHVGDQLQLQLEPASLAVLALFGELGRPSVVGEEPGVAAAASPAGGGQPAVTVVQQLGQDLARVQVLHDRAFGDHDLEVGSAAPVLVLALAVDPVGGPPVRVIPVGQQRRHVVVGDEPHVATGATVATVGAAHRHGALAPERHASRSPVTATHVELALVHELGHQSNATGMTPLP